MVPGIVSGLSITFSFHRCQMHIRVTFSMGQCIETSQWLSYIIHVHENDNVLSRSFRL